MIVPRLKISARLGFVVKIGRFPAQNDDENQSRRQNWPFLTPNWWREQISSSKLAVSQLKMVTRTNLVVKIDHFSPQIGDENQSRRQNWPFPTSKWWRERFSSSKLTISHPKLVTRANLVVKIDHFPSKIGDENQSRRQNWPFLTSKWWREPISSSKFDVSHPKMVTRTNLVVKIDHFSPQIGDESKSRRQNWPLLTSKWWREPISSSKLTITHLKMVTRTNLVAKIRRFSPQNGDENQSRRQNWPFLTPKWWREPISSSKLAVSYLKLVTRTSLVVKIGRFLPKIGDENEPRRQNWPLLTSKWWREPISSVKLTVFREATEKCEKFLLDTVFRCIPGFIILYIVFVIYSNSFSVTSFPT